MSACTSAHVLAPRKAFLLPRGGARRRCPVSKSLSRTSQEVDACVAYSDTCLIEEALEHCVGVPDNEKQRCFAEWGCTADPSAYLEDVVVQCELKDGASAKSCWTFVADLAPEASAERARAENKVTQLEVEERRRTSRSGAHAR